MPLGLQLIDVGNAPGDGLGDPARTAFQKINFNSEAIDAAMEDAELKAFVVKCYGKDTIVAVADAVEWWRQPYAFVVTEVRADVFAPQSGDDIVLDLKENGISILDSNLLVIPAGSETSFGFSPAPFVDNVILMDNSKMTIDVVDTGSGATALGLEVTVLGYVILATY